MPFILTLPLKHLLMKLMIYYKGDPMGTINYCFPFQAAPIKALWIEKHFKGGFFRIKKLFFEEMQNTCFIFTTTFHGHLHPRAKRLSHKSSLLQFPTIQCLHIIAVWMLMNRIALNSSIRLSFFFNTKGSLSLVFY